MIVGITGPNCSGKDSAAEYLIKNGFAHYSLSDIIREEAKNRNLPSDRDTLINIGNELREKYGEGVLAVKTLERISAYKSGNAVVTSIRNPSEIVELRKYPLFFLLGINAPVKTRYDRAMSRKSERDRMSFQEFVNLEKKENSKDSKKQQLSVCLGRADKKIINDSSLDELYRKIDNWVDSILC